MPRLLVTISLVTLVLGAPIAAADPVAVDPTGDAQAEILAVSGTGNASSDAFSVSGTGEASSTCRRYGTIPCATITGIGSTSGSSNIVDVGRARVCHNNLLSGSACIVNGEGDANHVVAIAGDGNAYGIVAVSLEGNARGGYVAIAPEGDASSYGATVAGGNGTNGWVVLSTHGNATGAVALAPFGHAQGRPVGIGGCDLRDELCHLP